MIILITIAHLFFNQPYIITVDHITPRMAAWCQLDENCMDMVKLSDDPRAAYGVRSIPGNDGSDSANCQLNNDCDQPIY